MQPFQDVDHGRAYLDAPGAVDTRAEIQRLAVSAATAGTARRTALSVVCDDEGVMVEHRALEARVGAHVLADLLAQVACIAVSCKPVEDNPEQHTTTDGTCQNFMRQSAYRSEIADKRKTKPEGESDPQKLLQRFA